MATPQPTGPLQKAENAVPLNYDALYDAGYSNYDIAKGVGQEVDKDLTLILRWAATLTTFCTSILTPQSLGAFQRLQTDF